VCVVEEDAEVLGEVLGEVSGVVREVRTFLFIKMIGSSETGSSRVKGDSSTGDRAEGKAFEERMLE
jgi:hypothetical protein